MSGATILILLGVAFLCFFILYLFNRADKRRALDFYKVYTPNGLQLVKKLEELFDNNEAIPWTGEIKLYQQMFNDLPKIDLDEFEKAIGIYGHVEPEGSQKSIAGEYVTILASNLAQRHTSQYSELQAIGETLRSIWNYT